jgi:hypothetical protein
MLSFLIDLEKAPTGHFPFVFQLRLCSTLLSAAVPAR